VILSSSSSFGLSQVRGDAIELDGDSVVILRSDHFAR